MIRSMTGFGSADLERSGQRLTAEIRSVNHRFCEVSMRGPKVALAFEDQVRQLIQDRFSRGKFNLTITWVGAGDQGEVLKLNEAVAQRYVDLMSQLKTRFKLAGEVASSVPIQIAVPGCKEVPSRPCCPVMTRPRRDSSRSRDCCLLASPARFSGESVHRVLPMPPAPVHR